MESRLHGKGVIEIRNLFESMRSEEDWKKSRLLVERSMFSDNKKVKMILKKCLEKKNSDNLHFSKIEI